MKTLRDLEANLSGLSLATDQAGKPGAGKPEADVLEKLVNELDHSFQVLAKKHLHFTSQTISQIKIDGVFPLYHEIAHIKFFLIDYHESKRPVLLNAARALINLGRENAALNLITSMPVSPDKDQAHDLIMQIAQGEGRMAARAKRLLGAYAFKYLEGFGRELMTYTYPASCCVDQRHHHLFISDVAQNSLFRFSLPEKTPQAIEGPWQRPLGLTFAEGLLWVCDSQGAALYGVNPQGQTVRQLELSTLLRGHTHRVNPEHSCYKSGRMYLYVTSEENRRGETISFSLDDPESSIIIHSELPTKLGGALLAHGDYIYSSDASSQIIYRIEPTSRSVMSFKKMPGEVYNLAALNDHIYASSPRGMYKLGLNGDIECWLSLMPYTNIQQAIAAMDMEGRTNIFLTDYSNNIVHHIDGGPS